VEKQCTLPEINFFAKKMKSYSPMTDFDQKTGSETDFGQKTGSETDFGQKTGFGTRFDPPKGSLGIPSCQISPKRGNIFFFLPKRQKRPI